MISHLLMGRGPEVNNEGPCVLEAMGIDMCTSPLANNLYIDACIDRRAGTSCRAAAAALIAARAAIVTKINISVVVVH